MTIKDTMFVHGWGEDSRIWDEMTKHLPEYNHHFIDLGFFGSKNDSPPKTDNPTIYLTHSLGTTWVLNNIPLEKIGALVAINGFGRFTDFASEKTVETMDKSLHRNMLLQMEMFWKNCNFPQNMRHIYKHELKRRELSQGLSWLRSWDKREELQDLKTQGVPVLSLGGQEDKILPAELMYKHWNDLGLDVVMKEKAGHALPLEAPQWCAQKIKEQKIFIE